jgi:hypothetical protein
MAEIKSTMDMVMERAARMAAAEGPVGSDDLEKEGMRAAAAYLRGESVDLAGLVAAKPPAAQGPFRSGVVQAMLRNIFLPREVEQQAGAELAMNGLVLVGRGSGELLAVFGEMKKLLDQYLQHRQQYREQLEGHFAQQMAQLEATMAQKTGMAMKLKPSQHPKFQEEWQRILTQLNDQYGNALSQYKQQIEQYLAGAR